MSTYEVLLFLHILGAFLIVGGAGLGIVTYVLMRRTRSTRQLASLLDAAAIAPMMTIPGALIAIVFGTWLVFEVSAYEFEQAWLALAYVGWIAAMGVSAAVLGPLERKAHHLAKEEAAAGRDESPALLAMIASPRLATVQVFLIAILVVFLYLMVFKPGL